MNGGIFQFSPSVARIFRFIGVVLATYSLSWEKGHGALGSLINSGRFLISPEQRAERIIKVKEERGRLNQVAGHARGGHLILQGVLESRGTRKCKCISPRGNVLELVSFLAVLRVL
jgi:hypothetical protein